MGLKREPEKDIYPLIKKWLEDQGYEARKTTGIGGVGQADVVGVKVIGTEFLIEPEVVSVEVKRSGKSLGRKATQALRYALFSNLPYAAVKFYGNAGFTERDKIIARQLGIGLLEIRDEVKEVLSPPYYHREETF